MSVLFLFGFMAMINGNIPVEDFNGEVFTIWALFSIADALWVRGR